MADFSYRLAPDGGTHCQVQGELTIYSAERAYQELLNALLTQAPLDIELDKVSDIDSSGIQILLQLQKEAQRQDIRLRLLAPSACVQEVVKLLGLGQELQLGGTV